VLPMTLFFMMFAALYARLSSWEADRSLLEFRMRSQHVADSLQAALEQQAFFLEQLGTTFATRRNPMRRADFRLLTDKLLKRFPMIQAVEWSPCVQPKDRDQFEEAQRSELPGFTIHGLARQDPGSAVTDYEGCLYPVTYLEPSRGNEEALGFDLASETDRRTAIGAALATGQVSATAPVRLVQEHGHEAGILLIYAASSGPNGPGIVLVVLRMATFVQDLSTPLASMMTMRLVDATQGLEVFDDINAPPAAPAFVTTFDFGKRRYMLRTAPTSLYMAAHRGWESWFVLVAGAFCTGLLGALLLLATGYAQRARELVATRTSELQTANRRLSAEIVRRERAQSALLQARRMEAMGQLTGGVAHDFNNLLTVISGNLELLRAHVSGERAMRLLSSAERGAQRGARLVDSLLAFARRQTLRPETVDPNQLIQEFSELFRRAIGEASELRLSLDETAGPCRVDPAQFQAALLNLVINARDAMPTGGVLTMESRSVERSAADETSEDEASSAGPLVEIVVRDTGVGMPPEVVEHAFEPFYTTRMSAAGAASGSAKYMASYGNPTARSRSDPSRVSAPR
jgi:signal transduction histidine kinase